MKHVAYQGRIRANTDHDSPVTTKHFYIRLNKRQFINCRQGLVDIPRYVFQLYIMRERWERVESPGAHVAE